MSGTPVASSMSRPMAKTDLDARVLIFAPVGRDGAAAAAFMRKVGIEPFVCASFSGLIEELARGAAVVLVAEEGLFGQDPRALSEWVDAQPPWSDLPFVILTSHQEQPGVAAWRTGLIAELRNVSLLERPIQTIT